jgi:hypothetical protein
MSPVRPVEMLSRMLRYTLDFRSPEGVPLLEKELLEKELLRPSFLLVDIDLYLDQREEEDFDPIFPPPEEKAGIGGK